MESVEGVSPMPSIVIANDDDDPYADDDDPYANDDDDPYADDDDDDNDFMEDTGNNIDDDSFAKALAIADVKTIDLHDNEDSNTSSNNHPYRNAKTQVIREIGVTKITYGQAKLYGLLNKDGNMDVSRLKDKQNMKDKESQRKHINSMTQISLPHVPPLHEENYKPNSKTVNADKISGITDRMSSSANRVNKDIEGEKASYEYKQDKLSCPSCKKYQSFDEYREKKRTCSLCRVKYENLNVCDIFSYEKKLKETLKKKELRSAKVEEEMYGYEKKPFKAKVIIKAVDKKLTYTFTPLGKEPTINTIPPKNKVSHTVPFYKRLSSSSKLRTSAVVTQAINPLDLLRNQRNVKSSNTGPASITLPAPAYREVELKVDRERKPPTVAVAGSRMVTEAAAPSIVRNKKVKMGEKFKSLLEY
jgi:hypothetical protein